jgi:archaellin
MGYVLPHTALSVVREGGQEAATSMKVRDATIWRTDAARSIGVLRICKRITICSITPRDG